MVYRRCLSLVIACVFLLQVDIIDVARTENVSVDVYYECMCPFSVNFVIKQLWPTYKKLGDHMEVRLYPYGNARTRTHKDGNGRATDIISCQHGPRECEGNTVQCCVLDLFRDTATQVGFVACMMSARHPYEAGPQCASEMCLPWHLISQCASSSYGKTLLKEMGRKTRQAVPPVRAVPHIVINGQHNGYYTGRARSNLTSLICDLLKQKPSPCRA
ncbi:gamma-interferon-inducible lysosomal thiol reductase-like [Ornithodoros turicata]|uniref:gamma-interferon-inducible lysosomal thiol reductase-like n=1 Tax=Ornithodoros turicata TaxID=34597 RepID=UPI00313981A7